MDRIIGAETEFGTAVWNKNKKEFDKDSMSMQFLVSSLGSANQFLENGARVYLDAGDHIETATPECLSAREAALYDKALEQKIAGIINGFNAGFMSKKKDCKFILFKNNADFSGHSHGCHENYLVPNYLWEAIAIYPTHPVSRFFQLFLAARQILCGSGFISRGMRFHFSQRTAFIQATISQSSTGMRAIIHQKNESLMLDMASRLHILVADSNMSNWSAYLRLGTAHLALLALEETMAQGRQSMGNHLFYHELDCVRLFRDINSDIGLTKKYPISKNCFVSVIDIHCMMIEYIEKTIGKILSKNEREILNYWEKFIEKIKQKDEDFLSCRLDWAIKKRLLESKLEKEGVNPIRLTKQISENAFVSERLASQMQALDLWYHDISRAGIFNQIFARGSIAPLFSESEIEIAKDFPPKTRAAWRGNAIRYFNKTLRYTPDFRFRHECWTKFGIESMRNDAEPRVFINYDPYNGNWDEVRDFIDHIC